VGGLREGNGSIDELTLDAFCGEKRKLLSEGSAQSASPRIPL